ncbi:MAG TPA: hypothetical protein VL221_08230 [Bacteroidota bacterium]|nr:hypothetical protein [Bacteroidota bacterium]
MKSVIPYVLMMTGTLVAALAIVLGLYWLKPGLFGVTPGPVAAVAKKDTTAAAAPRAAADTSGKPAPAGTVPPAAVEKPQDEAARLADSIRVLQATVQERDSAIARLQGTQAGGVDSAAATKTTPDSARAKQSKSFAKMIESMPAEQAVRILKGLDDREVQAILLAVKKRQAAKILSALDPDRAARMIRMVQ